MIKELYFCKIFMVESYLSQTAGLPSKKGEGFANTCSSTRRGFQQSRTWWEKGVGCWTFEGNESNETKIKRIHNAQTPMQVKSKLANDTHDRIGRGDLYRLNSYNMVRAYGQAKQCQFASA